MIFRNNFYFCSEEHYSIYYMSQNIKGSNIEFQANMTHLQWKYVNEVTWSDLIPLADITGPAGTITPEVIAQIVSQIPPPDLSGKVDKVTGSALVPTTEIAKIHANTLDHSNSLDHSHTNKTTLDSVEQALTTALKTSYDGAVTHAGSSHAPSNAQKNSDITKAEIEAKLTGEISTHTHAAGGGNVPEFVINVQALTSSPTDSQTVYFGTLPKAPVTVAATSKIYIRKSCTLKVAEIYCYSGTAGTNESWSLYVRKNNTTDTLIATLAVNTNERVFTNAALNVSLVAGDYLEIKGVQPLWATNPLTTIYSGYLYFE